MVNKKKEMGQVFTPSYIVNIILDEINYKEYNIIDKKIIEPSFGEGVFLIEIVKRLIEYCLSKSFSQEEIIYQLENNIYGVELDSELYIKGKSKLNQLLLDYNIDNNIDWKLCNKDFLKFTEKEFDFIVGNPPYIRVHNLKESTKDLLNKFKYSNGTTDMYILFFEHSLNMLKRTGRLGFITPNSFMKNTSQRKFRNDLISDNLIEKIIDFKSCFVFENAKTYTCITILNKNKINNELSYYEHNTKDFLYKSIIDLNMYKNLETWSFSTTENNELLLKNEDKKQKMKDICVVQNAIATNRDNIYISKIVNTGDLSSVYFNGYNIEKSILRPVVKASNCISENIYEYIIFPYEFNKETNKYEVICEDKLINLYPLTYKYLLDNKKELDKRNMKDNSIWYEYGRSQGLINSNKKKLVLRHIIKNDISNIDIYEFNEDVLIYSGLYLTSDKDLDYIKEILSSKEFCKYSILVGKDMQGGYKSISSKRIKNYGI